LKRISFKGDQVLIYQCVSGFDVIVEGHFGYGTYFIVHVIGHTSAVRDQYKKNIQDQRLVTEAVKEAFM